MKNSGFATLATNQGVVGSNPAGRAKFVLLSMACARKLAGLFFACAIRGFSRTWIAQTTSEIAWVKGFDLSDELPTCAALLTPPRGAADLAAPVRQWTFLIEPDPYA